MHMTHTGEQGYVLYIPNEFAVEIYDSIMEAGRLIMILNKLFALIIASTAQKGRIIYEVSFFSFYHSGI